MIISIPILDHGVAAPIASEMLRHRATVFRDILEWDVTVNDKGEEIDQFDSLPGTYLVSVDEKMRVQAGVRLLPTMGPYMASDVFADLLDSKMPPRSPMIWEASRLFSRPAGDASSEKSNRYWASNAHNQYVAELICGLSCYSSQIGLGQIVGVFDIAVERFLKSMGVACERLGEPHTLPSGRAVVGICETDTQQFKPLARKWGFDLSNLVKTPNDLRIEGHKLNTEIPVKLAVNK